MNFISEMEGEEIQVELKYCERCGGLWLRRQGSRRSVLRQLPCACGRQCPTLRRRGSVLSAQSALAGNERWKTRRSPPTEVRRETPHSQARIEYLQGVAAMEVWA